MDKSYLLQGKTSKKIYSKVKDLPIIDYHCHLSTKEIFEDKPFDNIGEMWLAADHYKWRLMRTAGIDEKYITGDASWHDRFVKYAEAVEFAAGNPLYHWSHMELSQFFKIKTPLRADTAEDIWNRANEYIKKNKLSPRKLIAQSNVEALCTTDDIIDTLEWHDKIREDKSINTRVLPSYRTDNLMLMLREGYLDYLAKLSEVSGIKVQDLETLKAAAEQRLNFFVEKGCIFTDIGMPYFPKEIYDDAAADKVFSDILGGKKVSEEDYLGLIGNLYVFFGKLYKENNLVMQLHLSVIRNSNTNLSSALGADCGVDCVGDTISGNDVVTVLDAINKNSGLPQTIVYTLNSANASQIASITGAFPGTRCGAAWWFCDHKRGIEEEINIISENSSLGSFLGMLTDSRSFLSYARHDYFRRILCNMIGDWVDKKEFDAASAEKLAGKISYYNIKEMVGAEKCK